jgi:hypothetical protein
LQDFLLLGEPALVVGEVHLLERLDVGKAWPSRDDEVGGFHARGALESKRERECGAWPPAARSTRQFPAASAIL